jgi:hypothetical protein
MPPDKPDCRWRCPAMVEAASLRLLPTAGLFDLAIKSGLGDARCA